MKDKLLVVLTWIWIISLATLATIYIAWLIYPIEIQFLKLEKVVSLKAETIYYNFNKLMIYLTHPFISDLNMPSFPSSEDGLKHFADVKYLFTLAHGLFVILTFPVIYFLRSGWKQKSIFLYEGFFKIAIMLPIFIVVCAFLLGFDQFFTLFHEVLFPGDSTWQFNPLTDPVIWILPETFFLHCFIIFLLISETITIILLIIGRKHLKLRKYKNKMQAL
ncbi:TIGR01906 family membrane protein [Streptococcus agalactiae]|nr:TIGR01906 family membrane protein [Streptococcus agalactiae]